MKPGGTFARDTAWMTAANYASLAARFASTMALTYLLGVAGFGTFGMLTGLLGFFGTLITLRINEVVVSLASVALEGGDRPKAVRLFRLGFLAEGVIGTILALLMLALPAFLGRVGRYAGLMETSPEFADWVRLFALVAAAGAVTGPATAFLQAVGGFRALSLLTAGGAFARAGLPLLGYALRPGLGGVVWGVLAAEVLSALGLGGYAWNRYRRRFAGVKASGWGGIVRETLPLTLHTALSSTFKAFNAQADVILLGALCGPVQVGLYKMACTLGGLVETVSAGITPVTLPALSRLWAGPDREEMRRWILRYALRLSGLAALAALGVVIASRIALPFYKSGEYAAAFPAVAWLAAAKILSSGFFWARPFSLAVRRPQWSTWMNLGAAFLVVGGIFLLAPRFGAAGVSATLLVLSVAAGIGWSLILGHELKRVERPGADRIALPAERVAS